MMSRLTTRAVVLLAKHVLSLAPHGPRLPSAAALAVSPTRSSLLHPLSAARYRSTSTKPAPVEPVEEVENLGAADLLDEVELDGEEWEGEEVEEGVFVSVPPPDPATARPKRPQTTSIKHLNRLLSRHQTPPIPEEELEERFVRGRGPGGQAINKTNSSVSLIHIPTGIRVQSQPTRSRAQNRIIARQILKDRLDLMRARGELEQAEEKGKGATEKPAEDGGAKPAPSRKERLAAEARMWSKQELRWEKERRRKANRAKKVKRRKGEEGEEESKGEGESKADGGESR